MRSQTRLKVLCASKGGRNAKTFVRCTTRHLKKNSLFQLSPANCLGGVMVTDLVTYIVIDRHTDIAKGKLKAL